MGNFLSNQRKEILQKSFTEDGIIYRVTLVKDETTNEVSIKKAEYIPTWVDKKWQNGKYVHTILPIQKALSETEHHDIKNASTISRAITSLQNTVLIVDKYLSEDQFLMLAD